MKCPDSQTTTEIAELTAAVRRLAQVVERSGLSGLGGGKEPLYKAAAKTETNMVSEQEMAAVLGIPRRTLSDHRLRGKLTGCWVQNGRRVFYHRDATIDAWKRGIA